MSRHTPRTMAYRRLVLRVRNEERDCWLCGGPIDPKLTFPHPFSFAADHVLPASKYPHLSMSRSNLRATHRICNARKGDRAKATRAVPTAPAMTVCSTW